MRILAIGSFAAGTLLVCAAGADAQSSGSQIPQTPIPRVATPLGTPPVESCIAGRIFGITSFQWSGGMSSPRDSTHIVYNFGSEPYVLETDNPTNRIRPGDYVVAVNGNPITTRAGADQFAYPPLGTATITVRRNNVNITIEQLIGPRLCPGRSFTFTLDSAAAQRVSGARAGAGGRGGGGGRGGVIGPAGGTAGMIRIDSASMTADSAAARLQRLGVNPTQRGGAVFRAVPAEAISRTIQLSTFGLTLTCSPVCTRTRSRDGSTLYWRYDGYPIVTNPSVISAAFKAGLRDGDELISVNGISPQVEEGALILNSANNANTLRVEVRRGGRVEKFTIKP